MVEKIYVTYNEVHKLCKASAQTILDDFRPNLIIAIGGGGFIPARILRSFLKKQDAPNIPIQAIGLSLYEQLPTATSSSGKDSSLASEADPDIEKPGSQVLRTQWLDLSSLEMANLIGKNVLIVDEVDDTRTTLEYAVRELQKDVNEAQRRLGRQEEGATRFSIFVLHNKDKVKRGTLPSDMLEQNRYLAAMTTGDVWICYPWEAIDIDEHDRLATRQT